MHRTWLVALVVAGCYSPKYKDCQFQCSSSSTCPTGLECNAGVCRLEGVTGPCVNEPDDAGGRDSEIDSPMAMWSAPVMVDLGPTAFSSPTLNADETEMFLEGTDGKIYRTTRTNQTQAWANPIEVVDLTAPGAFRNESPTLSSDGLALYFGSNRDASMGFDVQRVTRNAPTGPFSLPVLPVSPLNTVMNESGGSVTSGNQLIVFSSDRGTSTAIYEAHVSAGTWGAPTRLAELDSASTDAHPAITGNGLTIVFTSDRGVGGFDLFFTQRATVGSAFSTPEVIPELSGVLPDVDPWISADGSVMYFGRGQAVNRKIYRSTRL